MAQGAKAAPCAGVSFRDEVVYDRVAARSSPVRPCLESVVHITEDAPWVAYVRIPEAISVIPLHGLIVFLRVAVISAQVHDFVPCESVHLVESSAEHIVGAQVVHSGEDALLRDLHDSGDDGESQGLIGFQDGPEELSHEVHDSVMDIGVVVGVVHGVVVFVDQQDRFPPVVHLEHFGEVQKTGSEDAFVPVHAVYGFVQLLGRRVEIPGIPQFHEHAVEAERLQSEVGDELLVVVCSEILQTQEHHDVGVLLRIIRTNLGYPQAFEAVPVVGVSHVQIRVQHAEVEGFAEPAGTCEQERLYGIP